MKKKRKVGERVRKEGGESEERGKESEERGGEREGRRGESEERGGESEQEVKKGDLLVAQTMMFLSAGLVVGFFLFMLGVDFGGMWLLVCAFVTVPVGVCYFFPKAWKLVDETCGDWGPNKNNLWRLLF